MRKRSTILALVFIVVIIGAIWISNIGKMLSQNSALGFIGFTNVGGRVEALFALSNPPNA